VNVVLTPSGTSTPQAGSIAVQKNKGGMWYSTSWDGRKTVTKPLVNGSTIIVQ